MSSTTTYQCMFPSTCVPIQAKVWSSLKSEWQMEVYQPEVYPPHVCSLMGYFSVSLQHRLSLKLAEPSMSNFHIQSVVHASV